MAPPALALGVDPADPDLMNQPPRPRSEGVIDRRMRADIALVGLVMAAGTLLIFDAALPGGLIEGTGEIEYGRTMAFTTLMLFQLFNAFNARSDVHSAFRGLFRNRWLWAAVSLSVALHMLVIYVPFLQAAFGTVRLDALGLGALDRRREQRVVDYRGGEVRDQALPADR